MSSELLNLIIFWFLKFLFAISPLIFFCSLHIFSALLLFLFKYNYLFFLMLVWCFQYLNCSVNLSLLCIIFLLVLLIWSYFLCGWLSLVCWSLPSEKCADFLRSRINTLFYREMKCLIQLGAWKAAILGVSKIRFLAWGSSAPSRLRCKPNESHTMGDMSQNHFVFFLFKLGSTPKYCFLGYLFFFKEGRRGMCIMPAHAESSS